MINVHFVDTVHGENDELFDNYDVAMEYWQSYADVETCVAGVISDTDTGEIIWNFDDREII